MSSLTRATAMRITKKEIFIILGIVAAALTALLVINLTSQKGSVAVITIENNAVKEVDLSDNGEFTVKGIENVTFEVKDGSIRVKENDCSDKICVDTGWISKTNERIICMPKKMIVEIK